MINKPVKDLAVNLLLTIITITAFFSSLEIWARYKYFGGHLSEKGFYSRHTKYKPKKETPLRIVCVGGSTTHGGGNITEREAYPYYLEQALNEKLGGRVTQVLNSGLPATPTEHHRDFIKSRINDQELDIILLHSLYNHFSSFYPSCYTPMVDKIFVVRSSKVRTKYNWSKMKLSEIINVFLMEHSYFYTRLREKLLKITRNDINAYYVNKRRFVTGIGEEKTYKSDTPEVMKQVLADFIKRYYDAIEDIVISSKAKNVDVVLIIPPYPFFPEEGVSNLSELRSQQYYNNVFEKAKACLIKLGKKYNLLVIDADVEFIKSGRNKNLFDDQVHLTVKGNRLLADIIASNLLPYLNETHPEILNKK